MTMALHSPPVGKSSQYCGKPFKYTSISILHFLSLSSVYLTVAYSMFESVRTEPRVSALLRINFITSTVICTLPLNISSVKEENDKHWFVLIPMRYDHKIR